MAHMYPCLREKISAPTSEQLVYDELKKLPDSYTIFHSVQWVKKNISRNFTWYENDYLILHKEYGILLLEVKGGHCYFQDGLMHQKNSVTREEKILGEGNDPLSQAQRGIHFFRKIIEKSVLKYEGCICIEPLIWFPACEFDANQSMPQNYRGVSHAILGSDAFYSESGIHFEQRLKSVYDAYGAQRKTFLTDRQMEWIKNLIAPNFNLIPSPNIVKTEIDNAFIRLTNEQSVLLDYIEEQRYATIQGAAGTGKTMVAQMAAERFAKDGRKVLFLCYNAFLNRYLRQNCKKDNIDFYNVDLFVAEFCQGEAGSVEKRLTVYNQIDVEHFPYDDIIIDEAQDLGDQEVLFFKGLCELRDGHCFVFCDKNQIVTYDRSASKLQNAHLSWFEESECRLLLSKNCRNTIEIATTAYSVIDHDVMQKMNNISGDQPTILFAERDGASKLLDNIQYYLNQGFKIEDIAILSMKSEDKSFLKGAKRLGDIPFRNTLEGAGVLFTTARKFKGLENRVIIIIDIDETCFSNPAIKKAFYVACSRATQRLSLLICGNGEQISRIAEAIPGMALSGKGKIMIKTKTTVLKS